MKLFVCTIFLITCLNTRVLEQTSVKELFSEKRKSKNKYDQCIKEILGALAEVSVIAKDITAQNWAGMVEQIADLGKQIYDIDECFQNTLPKNVNELQTQLVDFATKIMSLQGDTLQCYVYYGLLLLVDIISLFSDMIRFNTDAVKEDLYNIQTNIRNIIKNC